MLSGIISADIIGSTSVSIANKYKLLDALKVLLKKLETGFNTFSRITKGDLIECYIPKPADTLRVALIIKCYIKSKIAIPIKIEDKKDSNSRSKYLKIHGVRMAIAIGEIERINKKRGIIEGEAIYQTGRAIGEYKTHDKERIVIKNTLQFFANNKQWEQEFEVVVGLIDMLLTRSTARQCEIIVDRLLGMNEDEIKEKLKITQSGVNQNLRAVGWNAIERAIKRFEDIIK